MSKKRRAKWYPNFPEDAVPKIANVPDIKIFSPSFAYAMCKKLDGLEFQAGTTAWWAMRVDKGYGICEERLCKYDTALLNSDFDNFPITEQMLENAYKYRTPAYQRLRSLNDIKKILGLNKQEATLSFDIFQGIYDAPKGYVPLPEANEKSVGVHCVRIIGYDDVQQVLIFANSWGKKWGKKGIGYIPYSYLGKYTIECWATMLKRHWEKLSQDLDNASFTDKKGNATKVQLHKVQSIVYGRPPLWVLVTPPP
jgi:C1A family cysteine protease